MVFFFKLNFIDYSPREKRTSSGTKIILLQVFGQNFCSNKPQLVTKNGHKMACHTNLRLLTKSKGRKSRAMHLTFHSKANADLNLLTFFWIDTLYLNL